MLNAEPDHSRYLELPSSWVLPPVPVLISRLYNTAVQHGGTTRRYDTAVQHGGRMMWNNTTVGQGIRGCGSSEWVFRYCLRTSRGTRMETNGRSDQGADIMRETEVETVSQTRLQRIYKLSQRQFQHYSSITIHIQSSVHLDVPHYQPHCIHYSNGTDQTRFHIS